MKFDSAVKAMALLGLLFLTLAIALGLGFVKSICFDLFDWISLVVCGVMLGVFFGLPIAIVFRTLTKRRSKE